MLVLNVLLFQECLRKAILMDVKYNMGFTYDRETCFELAKCFFFVVVVTEAYNKTGPK